MKRLKRILSLILVWSILLGLTVFSASAANQISVSMDTVSTANQGSTFTVDVKATDSKEKAVGSVGLYIYYKEEVLECSAFSAGTLLNGAQTNPKANIPSNNPKYKEGYAAATLSYAATSGTNVDGILGTLTFKVKDGLESCTTDIQVVAEFSDTTVGNPEQIAADVTGAKEITIKGVPPTIEKVELSNAGPIQVDNSADKTVSAKATSTSDKDITSQVTWSVDPADGGVSIAADGTITVAKDAKAGSYTITAGAKDGESQLGEGGVAPSATLAVERNCVATSIKFFENDAEVTSPITIAIPTSGEAITRTFTAKVFDQFNEVMKNGGSDVTATITAGSVTAPGSEDAATNAAIAATNGTVTVSPGKDASDIVLTATYSGLEAVTLKVQARSVSVDFDAALGDLKAITYGDSRTKAFTNWPQSGNLTGSAIGPEGEDLPGTFSVVDAEKPLEAGTKSITVKFTVGGSGPYAGTVLSKTYDTVVVKEKIIAVTWTVPAGGYTYNGAEQEPTATIADSEKVPGDNTALNPTVTIKNGATAKNVGSYTAVAALNGVQNYTISADTTEQPFTIKEATLSTPPTTLKDGSIQANETAKNTAAGLADAVKTANSSAATIEVDGVANEKPKLKITWPAQVEGFNANNKKSAEYNCVIGLAINDAADDDVSKNYTYTGGNVTVKATVTPVKATKIEATGLMGKTVTVAAVKAAGASLKDTLGVPEQVSVTYEPAIAGAATRDAVWDKAITDFQTAADKVATQGDQTVTITLNGAGTLPDWATLENTVTLPSAEFTIISKNPIPAEDITFADISHTYDGKNDYEVKATVATGKEYSDAPITYAYTDKDGKTVEKPTDVGEYTVTATVENNDYKGTKKVALTITAKPLADGMVTGVDTTDVTYDGQVHKPVPTVKDGETTLTADDYTVEYTGDGTNVGDVTVTVKGKGNYSGTITKTFKIVQAERALTLGKTQLILAPATKLTDALGVSCTTDLDSSAVITYTLEGAATAVTRSNDSFTAVGNGTVTVKVNIPATTNYKAAAEQTATIHAWANPAEGLTVKTNETVTTNDKVAYTISGTTVTVSGIKAEESKIVFETPAEDTNRTATYNETAKTLTIKQVAPAATLAEYTVDASGVSVIPTITVGENTDASLTLETGTTAGTGNLQGEGTHVSDANDAAKDTSGNKLTGADTAAAAALAKKAEEAATAKNTEITEKLDVAEGVTIKVEVSLNITAKEAKKDDTETSYTVSVKPEYTIVATGKKGNEEVNVQLIDTKAEVTNDMLKGEVTVQVKLPTYLNDAITGNKKLYVDHIDNAGRVIERMMAAVTSGCASWKVRSFSDFKLSVQNEPVTVTFTKDDGSTYTGVYDYTKLGQDLPSEGDKADGSPFTGWTIGGKVHTKVDADFLEAIAKTPNATPAYGSKPSTDPGTTDPTTPSKPSTGGSSGGSSGGGSSSSSTSVTVKHNNNGTITADLRNAKKGDTVTLTVRPKKGYELDTLTVTDKNGREIDVRAGRKDNTFTFTMPEGKVNVEATYKREGSSAGQPGASNPFYDVSSTSPFYDAILWAYQTGITGGTTDTTFAPGNACTRAQTVTFLWRAAGSPSPRSTVNPFTDIQEGSYYYDAVLWAVEEGITNGLSATTFGPGATVNRGQVVTFLYRSAKAGAVDAGNPFTDVANDAYYAGPVQWAVVNGITNGTSATTFAPGSPCTRGQIVTFLYRHFA